MRPEAIRRTASLLLCEHLLHHTRAQAPHVLGDVHRPQAIVARLLVDTIQNLLRQLFVLVHRELVGHQLLVHEVPGGLAKLLQLRGDVEVHAESPISGGCFGSESSALAAFPEDGSRKAASSTQPPAKARATNQ